MPSRIGELHQPEIDRFYRDCDAWLQRGRDVPRVHHEIAKRCDLARSAIELAVELNRELVFRALDREALAIETRSVADLPATVKGGDPIESEDDSNVGPTGPSSPADAVQRARELLDQAQTSVQKEVAGEKIRQRLTQEGRDLSMAVLDANARFLMVMLRARTERDFAELTVKLGEALVGMLPLAGGAILFQDFLETAAVPELDTTTASETLHTLDAVGRAALVFCAGTQVMIDIGELDENGLVTLLRDKTDASLLALRESAARNVEREVAKRAISRGAKQ
jgi:hypothetical protein